MSGIGHVIFDLDGTLVDSAPHCADILSQMLRERGSARSVSAADARDFLTRGGQQIVAALLGDECGDLDRELTNFRTRYRALPTPPQCLFPGVADGLHALAEAGVGIGMCSNKPQPLSEKIVRELGLAGIITAVAGSLPERPLKPAPDLALLALAGLGASPDQCLFVGDSEVDRQTAAAAGIPFLFVTWGYAEPGFALGDTAKAERFEDVVDRVLGRQSGLPRVA